MKKKLSFIFFGFESLYRFFYFILAIIIIFLLAYFLGYEYLLELKGTDSLTFLNFTFWYDRWFPRIPYWYPLHNGGIVPLWGYPLLPHFIIILVHNFFKISIAQAFQIVGFMSVPLTALGLYFFVWTRIKNQTMALIGAVFYLISPISWAWLFIWGLYAESISYIFIFPALTFYDYFLSASLDRDNKRPIFKRIALFFSVIFFSFLFLAHPISFVMTFFFLGGLTIFEVLEKQRRPILNSIFKIILYPAIVFVLTFSLISFIFLDFNSYTKFTSAPRFVTQKEEFLKIYGTPVESVFGFQKIPPTEFRFGHRDFVVPFAVWVPAIFGFLAAIILSRKVFVLGLFSLITFSFFKWPIFAWQVMNMFPFNFIEGYLQQRPILDFFRFPMPILGAFGVWAVFKLAFELPTFWVKKTSKLYFVKKFSINLSSSFLSLALALVLIIFFANKPDNLWSPNAVRYGPEPIDLRAPFTRRDINDSFSLDKVKTNRFESAKSLNIKEIRAKEFLDRCSRMTDPLPICYSFADGKISKKEIEEFSQECNEKQVTNGPCLWIYSVDQEKLKKTLLDINSWPKPQEDINIDKLIEGYHGNFGEFITEHKDDKMLRIDVSPTLGGIVQTLNLKSDISQMSLYIFQLSLLGPYWGYEQQVINGPGEDTTADNNIAKWFGLKYLFLDPLHNPLERFQNDKKNWKKLNESQVWEFLDAPKLYSWSVKKPAVLVIGSLEKRAYEPFFRVAVNGGFSYDDGWLVPGKENIDDYSLSDLKKFDTIVLFGYSYKNRGNAFNMLSKYVKEGGNLYISTGWQFVDKDWQIKKAPDVFPVNDLEWAELKLNKNYKIEDQDIAGNINSKKISPLQWTDKSWGVSVPANGLKDWAKPVLSYDGVPLVAAGKFGEGKVVWSGINFPGHIHTYEYKKEEIALFNNILRWLGHGDPKEEKEMSQKVSVIRDYPDKIEFTFNRDSSEESNFYWRESQYPNWKADLIFPSGEKKNIKIYRAGPGFMFMNLPPLNNGTKMILEFKTGLQTYLGRIITIFTFIALLVYIFKGDIIIKNIKDMFLRKADRMKSLASKKVVKSWDKTDEEEDY